MIGSLLSTNLFTIHYIQYILLFADMPFQKKKGLRLSLCKRGSYRRKRNQSIRTPGASPYPKKVKYLSPFKTDISFSNCNKRKFKSPSKVSKKQISFQAYCNINEIDEPFVIFIFLETFAAVESRFLNLVIMTLKGPT
jgi:hypothetical protein